MPPYQRPRLEKKRVALDTTSRKWPEKSGFSHYKKKATTGAWKWQLQKQLQKWTKVIIYHYYNRKGLNTALTRGRETKTRKERKTAGAWKWKLQKQLQKWTKVMLIMTLNRKGHTYQRKIETEEGKKRVPSTKKVTTTGAWRTVVTSDAS